MREALDTWSIGESAFDVRLNRHFEGLLAIGSGPLQQRAALEEGLSDDPQNVEYLRVMGNVTVEDFPDFKSRVGTYMPGVSGPHPTCRDEMINLPALHGLVLHAGPERLDMEHGRVAAYRRWLDLRTGRLSREFDWHTAHGTTLHVRFERFLSARRRHVMALRCTVRHLAGPPVELRIAGTLDADVRTNGFDHFDSVRITGEHEPITVAVRTNGGDEVAAAALMTSDVGLRWAVETEPRWAALAGVTTLGPERCSATGRRVGAPREPGREPPGSDPDGGPAGSVLTICKFAAMTSSRHVRGSPLDAARKLVWDAAAAGFDRLAQESDAIWRQRWEATDVQIEGDERSQLALRVSLYHMLRVVVEDDPRVAIDAKAAAGEAYCGRYFWDTEIFMLPLFLYTRPEVGRTLARYRYASLEGARRNARRYGCRGAKYGWESAPSGDDNCPNWQYSDHELHVTADAAYGLWHAHLACPEDAALLCEATEVLIETARYWRDRVYYNPQRDEYEMLLVMGPDEYTPFSRNNAYTNHLVAFLLSTTRRAWEELESRDPGAAAGLRERLRLRADELERCAAIASRLRVPYDAQRRLVLQSDDFFDYEPLEFDVWWPDRSQPIGRVVAQERLYRSQVLKQADVVQLLALFPQQFDREQMHSAYATYEPLTSHDSSLSRSMHAIVAAWIGRDDDALRFWDQSVGLDLTPGAAAEGIHAACAGANWQVAVFGFGGLRTRVQSEALHVEPHLPARWTALRFPFVWCGQPLRIHIERESGRETAGATPARTGRVIIEHHGDAPIAARVCGQALELPPRSRRSFDWRPAD